MTTIAHEISAEDAERVASYLALKVRSDDARKGEILWETTVVVSDRLQADLKVVNGLNEGDAPYVDAVLFEDGAEVECLDIRDEFLGEYRFKDATIVVSASPSPALSR